MHVDSSSYDIYIQNKTKQKHTIPKYSVLHQSQSQIFSPGTPDSVAMGDFAKHHGSLVTKQKLEFCIMALVIFHLFLHKFQ